MPPSKDKRRYVAVKVDAFLRDRFPLAGRFKRSRDSCSENVWRCSKFATFAVVFLASLCQTLAPWMLSCIEAVSVLLIYFLGTPRPQLVHTDTKHLRFSYTRSLEDIVLLSTARALWLSLAYALGSARNFHRPYQVSSYALAAVLLPYTIVKAGLYKYGHHASFVLLLFITSAAFSICHFFASRRIVERARKRHQLGLLSFGYPWEEGEDQWALMGGDVLPPEAAPKCSSDSGTELEQDLPLECLADDESKFVQVGGVTIHYKEVAPRPTAGQAGEDAVGVLLVHGFGGGAFSWRHLLEPIAMQCRCRVVAYDQPGFGLSSRPKVTSDADNVYKVTSQAHLLHTFCAAIGLRRVVLVAHADGCLLTLIAAALATSGVRSLLRSASGGSPSIPRPPQSQEPGAVVLHMHDTPPAAAPSRSVGGPLRSMMGGRSDSPPPGAGEPLLPTRESSGSSSSSSKSEIFMGDQQQLLAPPPPSVHPPPQLEVMGLVHLHPNFSSQVGASGFTRLLGKSKLGRRILRPLLRTEIGDVANRRAWYNSDKLTPEVLELYKAPLRVEGWDYALLESSRQKQDLCSSDLSPYVHACSHIPAALITGEHDRIVPPSRMEALRASFTSCECSVIPNCGHLSHEETPSALTDLLVAFCHNVLPESA